MKDVTDKKKEGKRGEKEVEKKGKGEKETDEKRRRKPSMIYVT